MKFVGFSNRGFPEIKEINLGRIPQNRNRPDLSVIIAEPINRTMENQYSYTLPIPLQIVYYPTTERIQELEKIEVTEKLLDCLGFSVKVGDDVYLYNEDELTIRSFGENMQTVLTIELSVPIEKYDEIFTAETMDELNFTMAVD